MAEAALHRFEAEGSRFVIDPETCFCFECDAISWDVLEYYPATPVRRIVALLREKHAPKEIEEVVGELEWLRASKSILPAPNPKDLQKQYEVERGLKRLSVEVTAENAPVAQAATALLLGRSGSQQEIELALLLDSADTLPAAAEAADAALRQARLADKRLTVALHLPRVALARAPKSLAAHHLGVHLELSGGADAREAVQAFSASGLERMTRIVEAMQGRDGVLVRAVLRPAGGNFAEAVRDLDKAGFKAIDIDLDGALVQTPSLDPAEMLSGLEETAGYYAKRLLDHRYFRVEPMASAFWRIYNGTPLHRADPIGTNELAVDAAGQVYPAHLYLGREADCLGDLKEGTLDKEALRAFDDVGAMTTQACRRCWARNLCGGGTAAVHEALGGSFRRPPEAWCDAQRAWMHSAVSAFNLLSSAGVNFTRLYGQLDQQPKPSLLTMAKAAFSMQLSMRALEESDAELLTKWENWSEAAYFLANETGLFMATQYDREMDSLHPRGLDQEFMLLRKSGEPMGLLKIRPVRPAGAAQVWIYFRDPADYAASGPRKSFRFLLNEAGKQQELKQILTPAGPTENALAAFLEAAGFEQLGVAREALFLHGAYHDLRIYGLAMA